MTNYKEYCLCYISKKAPDTTSDVIQSIVNYSANYNAKSNITGVLIEYDTNFLQYLERDPVIIYTLFQKISVDERHQNVMLLNFKPIDDRFFVDWNMAYRNIIDLDEQVQHECVNSIELIKENLEFWRGIDVIEKISNLT